MTPDLAIALLAALLWGAAFLWLSTTVVFARLQPGRRRAAPEPAILPPVSIIVPTGAGQDERAAGEREATVRSLLALDYPDYEIIVCFDRGDEAGPWARRLRRAFPDARVRITVASAQGSANAKVDAMASGAEQARHDLLLYSDDDVLLDPQHLRRLVAQKSPEIGLVSAAAVGVQPGNLWGELEMAFMNGTFGRLHLAGDFHDRAGVLGKSILVHRADIARAGGLAPTGVDCCEDAALTQNVAATGKRTVLGDRPVLQPVGRQRFLDVWRRHRRWLSCRRQYIPGTFVSEALYSTPIACLAAALAAGQAGISPGLAAAATALLWGGLDGLHAATGPGGWRPATSLAWLIRELVFLPMWGSALVARTVRWHGRAVPVAGPRQV